MCVFCMALQIQTFADYSEPYLTCFQDGTFIYNRISELKSWAGKSDIPCSNNCARCMGHKRILSTLSVLLPVSRLLYRAPMVSEIGLLVTKCVEMQSHAPSRPTLTMWSSSCAGNGNFKTVKTEPEVCKNVFFVRVSAPKAAGGTPYSKSYNYTL